MRTEIPLESLQKENDQLQNNIVLLQHENSYLKEQVEWFRRQIFGQKSERSVPEQTIENEYIKLIVDDTGKEYKEEKSQEIPAHKRKKRNKTGNRTIEPPADLPVERHIIDIPENEKICAETGKPLVKIGEEVTKKLAVKPQQYFIKEIVRPKYALPKGSEGGISIAPLPESLLTRCFADESFLANILVQKYGDHLPLYRIEEILFRNKIKISRQVLCKWVARCGAALAPLCDVMKAKIFESANAFIDETPIGLQDPGKGKLKQAYMWVLVGGKERAPPYRIYNFFTNRKHDNANAILDGYKGVLHSDKYGAYEKIGKKEYITWCPCWAHIRRKFFEAESGDPLFRKWILRKIRYLYMFEKVAWNRNEEERLRIRQEKEGPIIDEIISKVKNRLLEGKVLPKSKFSVALGYIINLIPHLKGYTSDAWAHIDNNVAERAIRPLAIGRKNWLFIGSEASGKSAAVIISLIQTCRGLGVNPRDYLEDVMRRLMSHSYQKLHELLPDHWAKKKGLI